jgi:hypothetical protein
MVERSRRLARQVRLPPSRHTRNEIEETGMSGQEIEQLIEQGVVIAK